MSERQSKKGGKYAGPLHAKLCGITGGIPRFRRKFDRSQARDIQQARADRNAREQITDAP